jgi:putative ABC transport system permease protein
LARYRDAPQRAAFYAQLFERLSALPGVRAAGGVSELPLGDMANMGTFEIEGRPAPSRADLPHADWRSASPRYFNAINLGLRAGRLFDERDGADAPRVAIIDEAAASKYWPGESPIGRRLTTDGGSASVTWREIVGVVRTVHHDSLDKAPRGTVYFPLAQRATASIFAVLHTDGNPIAVLPSARAAVRAVDPALPVFDARTLEERLGQSLGRRRIATWLIGVFACLALALAVIGVYGVMSYDVSQRAREIGIRMALGANGRDVLRLVLGGGLKMAALGVVAGAAIASWFARVAGGLLFGVSPYDPLTYAGLATALLGLAVAAAYLPARRAIALSPIASLRD